MIPALSRAAVACTVTSVAAARITFLEGVRGVAASLVVVQHLLATHYPAYRDWTHDHVDLGRVGVVAFFLVSGYVIPLSLAGQSLRTFAIRRFFRLYPVYWVALVLFVVFEPGLPSAPVVLLNLLMLQGLIGAVNILPVAWTLSIELVFYAQSAVAKARGLLDASVHAGWAWLALYLVLCVGERVTGRDLPTTLPLLLFTASLGHALHLRRFRLPMLVAAVLLVPAGAYVGVDGSGEWPPFTYSASFLVGIALFLAFHAARSAARPLVFLGAISYAMYLFHPVVSEAVHEVPGLDGRLAVIVVNVVVVLAVSWLAHRFLEAPSIRLGRRLSRQPR
jgi:peptidoglycan/LPS O-acetylase OafA/YrhL